VLVERLLPSSLVCVFWVFVTLLHWVFPVMSSPQLSVVVRVGGSASAGDAVNVRPALVTMTRPARAKRFMEGSSLDSVDLQLVGLLTGVGPL